MANVTATVGAGGAAADGPATEARAKRRISILGATGSIGTNTLAVVTEHPGDFEVEAVTAFGNAESLARVARQVGAKVAVSPTLFVQSTHRVAGIREQSERGTAVGGRVGQRRGQGRPTGVEDDELGDVRAVDDLDQAHHTMAAEGPQHLGLSTQSGALSAPSGLPQHRLVADPVAGQGHPLAGGAVVVESVQGVGLQRLEVVHHVSSRVSPAGGPAGGWGRTGCCRPGRERRGGRCAGSRSAWWRPPWSR